MYYDEAALNSALKTIALHLWNTGSEIMVATLHDADTVSTLEETAIIVASGAKAEALRAYVRGLQDDKPPDVVRQSEIIIPKEDFR